MKENYNQIKKEIKQLRKEYERDVKYKNLFSIPIQLGVLGLGYLGFRTLLSYKLGVNIEDLEPLQKQIMSIMGKFATASIYASLFFGIPATLCYKLDAKESKKKLDTKEKELSDLLDA